MSELLFPSILPGVVAVTPVGAPSAIMAISRERDIWISRVLAAWRDGYRIATLDGDDRYQEGFYDGAMYRKKIEHEIVGDLRVELSRWGIGGREDANLGRVERYKGGRVPWIAQEPSWDSL